MRAGIALGSNLGDRLHFLREAGNFLFALHDGPGPFLCSRVYETEPVDCPDGSPRFLNAAIELTTSLAPIEFMDRLQSIEQKLGRPADHSFHGPRTLDLDLLYCDNLQMSLDGLTLPHPGIAGRLFVLKPLNDICPDCILPGQAAAIHALCESLATQAPPITVFCEILR
jgi:2-amino-4-hydroxy-6-hydroxymethyldihydropteridine diphosphokinase